MDRDQRIAPLGPMAMPTLVLPPRISVDSSAVAGAAAAAGWRVERLTSWRVSGGLAERDPVIYGEPLFADVVSGPLQLALLQPTPNWLADLPFDYLHRRVLATTLDEARRHAQRAFFKPADDKCFSAGVRDSGAGLPPTGDLPADSPVLISQPVEWEVEYRFFVHGRRIVTGSPYWRQGALAQAEDGSWPAPGDERTRAEAFAEGFLADDRIPLPPALVLDVGRIAGVGWAVVEANAAWGSGIYGCDPAGVLPALRASCRPHRAVGAEERCWLRPLAECEAEPSPPTPGELADADGTVTLFRPVGPAELRLIEESAFRAFPPRRPDQPIFYPVLDETYAVEIARDWNVRESGAVFVTRFRVRVDALVGHRIHQVGAQRHRELWIPAEHLPRFNQAIVGSIEVTRRFGPADSPHPGGTDG